MARMEGGGAVSEISVITPTIGRPASLRRLLTSLARQTCPVREVIIADGSDTDATRSVVEDPAWVAAGLNIMRIRVSPPHAVRQREAAIKAASGSLLLLLDDDVELESNCVQEMTKALEGDPKCVAVMADFMNQDWPQPTRAWRAYLRLVHGLRDGEWAGRVVGPLPRFGFGPLPATASECEWFGAGNSIVTKDAFERAGGIADFFLCRSTINEDVDLGLRVAKVGKILFCQTARMTHFHDPSGRVTVKQAAEDDLHNRYHVLHRSAHRAKSAAFAYLKGNIAFNRIGNVEVINAAAAADFARLHFTDVRRDDMNRVPDDGIEVEAVPLDVLVTYRGCVDLLKVDVEGYELPVLRGAPEILSLTQCLLIEIAEHHFRRFGYELVAVLEELERHGLRVLRPTGPASAERVGRGFTTDKVESLIAVRDVAAFTRRTG